MKDCSINIESDPLEIDAIIEFLAKAFGPDYFSSSNLKSRLFAAEPSLKPENFVSARDLYRQIAGIVRIVEREMLIDGVPLKMGFITSVAIHPKYRCKGLATELIQFATDLLTKRGFDFACVHGRRAVDGFYPKFGFVHVGRYLDLEILARIDPVTNITAVSMEPIYLPILMQCYQKVYHPLSGSVYRSEGVWQFLLEKASAIGATVHVLHMEHNTRAIGYIICMQDDLIEVAVDEKAIPGFWGLFKQLGLKRLRIHPRHPIFNYCRQHYSTVLNERFALDGGYMARVLNLNSILQKLSNRLVERMIGLAKGVQRISILGLNIDLISGNVVESCERSNILFENDSCVAQMIMGFKSPREIPHTQSGLPANFLENVFPDLGFHSASLDEV